MSPDEYRRAFKLLFENELIDNDMNVRVQEVI